MMKLVILSFVIIGSLGAPPFQTFSLNEDGTYQFSYDTGNEGGSHSRSESKGSDGVVIGKYSYKDPTGEMTAVNYRADDDTGFLASMDGEVPQPSANEQLAALEEEVKPEDSVKDDEVQTEETKSPSTTEPTDDDDEENALNLEEPIYDGPPEGFPPGFFSEQFSSLRRLPEPKKEEKATKEKDDEKTDEPPSDGAGNVARDPLKEFSAGLQPEGFPAGFFLHHFTGLRRLGEPVQEQESTQTIDGTKSDDPDTAGEKKPIQEIHSTYILPFPSLIPQLWPSSSHHKPLYVYSYQQPNAYAYGYQY